MLLFPRSISKMALKAAISFFTAAIQLTDMNGHKNIFSRHAKLLLVCMPKQSLYMLHEKPSLIEQKLAKLDKCKSIQQLAYSAVFDNLSWMSYFKMARDLLVV